MTGSSKKILEEFIFTVKSLFDGNGKLTTSKASSLNQACDLFYKISTVQGLTVYHGTDGTKLESILSQGLKAFKGDRYQPKSVYLTYDKETAARYAVNHHVSRHELPLILEIYISGAHRVKKLVRDELDRPENAHYEDLSNYESFETEVVRSLEDDIEQVIGTSVTYNFKREYLDLDIAELTDLRGKNIYKILLEWARNNEENIQQFKQKMFTVIPVGKDYENLIEVAGDGTLTLTKAYYESLHQQRYPKDLPTSTIKSIWVSKVPEALAQGREQISIEPKLLAHEVTDTFESVRGTISQYLWKGKVYDQETMQDILETIQDKDPNKLFSDAYVAMEKAIQSDDWMAFKSSLEGIDYTINEGWFDDHHLPAVTFTKFTPEEAIKLVRQLLNNEQL